MARSLLGKALAWLGQLAPSVLGAMLGIFISHLLGLI